MSKHRKDGALTAPKERGCSLTLGSMFQEVRIACAKASELSAKSPLRNLRKAYVEET